MTFIVKVVASSGRIHRRAYPLLVYFVLILCPWQLFANEPAPATHPTLEKAIEITPPTVVWRRAPPATYLTLEKAIEMALKNHPLLRSVQAVSKGQEARVGQARAGLYPSVDLNSQYGLRDTDPDRYSASLSLRQLIYDFGQTQATITTAEEMVQAGRLDKAERNQQVALDVQVAYYALLGARRLLAVHEETVAQFVEHLAQTKAFFEIGIRPKFDVTKAELDLTNARLNQVKAVNAAEVAEGQLLNAMGILVEALPRRGGKIQIEEPLEEPPLLHTMTASEDEMFEKAMLLRPAVHAIAAKERSAWAAIRFAERGYFPIIAGTADYTYLQQGFQQRFLEGRGDWGVGISLTAPLLTGSLQASKVAEARAHFEQVQADAEALRQDIRLEIKQARANLSDARERVQTSDLAIRQAQESLDLANGRFQAGVGNTLERTDAQTLLTSAKTAKIQAIYDYNVAAARLEAALGMGKGHPIREDADR